MRETSIGLGVIQALFTIFIAAMLVWLALGAGIAALIVWGVFHLIVTLRGRVAASVAPAPCAAQYHTPAAYPPSLAPPAPYAAGLAPPAPHVGPASQAPSSPYAIPQALPPFGVAPKPTPPVTILNPSTVARERTNAPGLAAVALLALTGIPFLLGNISWAGAAMAAAAVFVALVGCAREDASRATSVALLATAAIGGAVMILSAFSMWTNSPKVLYGSPSGENPGEMVSIIQLERELPCVNDLVFPAEADQGFYSVEVDLFEVTMSCRLRDGEDILPVVFVQATSAEELERIFTSGAIVVERSKDDALWVERDGAVAVIAADEESGDLIQDVGTSWISLDKDRPGE